MTRKHFIALAEVLQKLRPTEIDGPKSYGNWMRCVDAIADVCKANNDRFDYHKFIERCES